MSDTRTGDDAPATAPPAPPSPGPSARGARLLMRFLTLREGSIIVVTLLTIVYFTIQNDRFFTHANFETLLPYFAPFAILAVGEVMLMVAGESICRSARSRSSPRSCSTSSTRPGLGSSRA